MNLVEEFDDVSDGEQVFVRGDAKHDLLQRPLVDIISEPQPLRNLIDEDEDEGEDNGGGGKDMRGGAQHQRDGQGDDGDAIDEAEIEIAIEAKHQADMAKRREEATATTNGASEVDTRRAKLEVAGGGGSFSSAYTLPKGDFELEDLTSHIDEDIQRLYWKVNGGQDAHEQQIKAGNNGDNGAGRAGVAVVKGGSLVGVTPKDLRSGTDERFECIVAAHHVPETAADPIFLTCYAREEPPPFWATTGGGHRHSEGTFAWREMGRSESRRYEGGVVVFDSPIELFHDVHGKVLRQVRFKLEFGIGGDATRDATSATIGYHSTTMASLYRATSETETVGSGVPADRRVYRGGIRQHATVDPINDVAVVDGKDRDSTTPPVTPAASTTEISTSTHTPSASLGSLVVSLRPAKNVPYDVELVVGVTDGKGKAVPMTEKLLCISRPIPGVGLLPVALLQAGPRDKETWPECKLPLRALCNGEPHDPLILQVLERDTPEHQTPDLVGGCLTTFLEMQAKVNDSLPITPGLQEPVQHLLLTVKRATAVAWEEDEGENRDGDNGRPASAVAADAAPPRRSTVVGSGGGGGGGAVGGKGSRSDEINVENPPSQQVFKTLLLDSKLEVISTSPSIIDRLIARKRLTASRDRSFRTRAWTLLVAMRSTFVWVYVLSQLGRPLDWPVAVVRARYGAYASLIPRFARDLIILNAVASIAWWFFVVLPWLSPDGNEGEDGGQGRGRATSTGRAVLATMGLRVDVVKYDWVVYGSYPDETGDGYHIDTAIVVVLLLTTTASAMWLARAIYRRRGNDDQPPLHTSDSATALVLGGWDHSVETAGSVAAQRVAVRARLLNMVERSKGQFVRTVDAWYRFRALSWALFAATLVLAMWSAYAIASGRNDLTEGRRRSVVLPGLLLALIGAIAPPVMDLTVAVDTEASAAARYQQSLLRTVIFRAVVVATAVVTLATSNETQSEGCFQSSTGVLLLQTVVFDAGFETARLAGVPIARRVILLFLSSYKYRSDEFVARFLDSRLDVPVQLVKEMVRQSIVWLAVMYSPVLSVVALAASVVSLFVGTIAVISFYKLRNVPTEFSSGFAYKVALGSLLAAMLAISWFLAQDFSSYRNVSAACGPHFQTGGAVYASLYTHMDTWIRDGWLGGLIEWSISPVVLYPAIVFLLGRIFADWSRFSALDADVAEMLAETAVEKHDKNRLLAAAGFT